MAENRIVSVRAVIDAAPEVIFEEIADPSRQPAWDGNDNLGEAAPGQRVRGVGEVFVMTTTTGKVRENHVLEFEEGRRIAWSPAEPGGEPLGHVWRWEVRPVGDGRTEVVHTYDWTRLRDEGRYDRARRTTPDRLHASVSRLAEVHGWPLTSSP